MHRAIEFCLYVLVYEPIHLVEIPPQHSHHLLRDPHSGLDERGEVLTVVRHQVVVSELSRVLEEVLGLLRHPLSRVRLSGPVADPDKLIGDATSEICDGLVLEVLDGAVDRAEVDDVMLPGGASPDHDPMMPYVNTFYL